jgi:hypothetical protein
MYDILFYTFSIVNLLAIKNIYWPTLKNHIDELATLHSIFNNWQLVFMAYSAYFVLIFKQWLLKTAQPLDEKRYLITHILNGKVVKFVIKPICKNLKGVVNESYDECYYDESKPFFRYEVEQFTPDMIGLNKPLFVHFESETKDDVEVIHVFPKVEKKTE